MTTRKRTTSPGTARTGKTTATAATPDCSPNPPAGSEQKSGRSGELSVAVEGADLEGSTWDQQVCRTLIDELWSIREGMLRHEEALAPVLRNVSADYRASARNLAHYLVLRQDDRRPLQDKLAWIGVSSLGRSESHVLANLDKVLGILHRLTGQAWEERSHEEPAGIRSSRELLVSHTASLLGDSPPGRAVRIMVTLPSHAAIDYGLVHQLVASGMDIARINCAHDGVADWEAMAGHVRRAAKAVGRPVRILMDLGGPKLRTGAIPPGPAVLKLKPKRNDLGHLIAPARVGLRQVGSRAPVAGAVAQIGVAADWLAHLELGDKLSTVDARGAARSLRVVERHRNGVLAECEQTVYVAPETRLECSRLGKGPSSTGVAELPRKDGSLVLHRGDRLRLTREERAEPADSIATSRPSAAPTIACTLPEVFAQVCVGERIWFDDGRIGGVIRSVDPEALEVEIMQVRATGDKLMADKGINLPDSQLNLPALTERDLDDLTAIARQADLVGLSFVQHGRDIDALRAHLGKLGADHVGIILKIETRRAFENLPELLLSAMGSQAAGVMIARGDLAVECGYERLAEVQEEILWAAEAAHMPVVWATQVLETLAKTGRPSRAEITDAAMGERAECVMLNKGPYILDAMRTLNDILSRMQSHQAKKRSLLRALSAWSPQ
jgi:pyruvate kinase